MLFYAARQPIFTLDKHVFGYELLFRDSLENAFPNVDGDVATSKIIEVSQFNLGLEDFTGDKPAFINFSQELILKEFPLLVAKENIVVEILETARPTKTLLQAVIKLKEAGYTIALDDYVHEKVWMHFFPYIDIIKVDFAETTKAEMELIFKAAGKYDIQMLAEKVETYDEFNMAVEMGYTLFQGYFFSKPEMMQTKAMSPSQMSLAELLYESSKADMELDAIIDTFQRDVTLSFKLLRYANSAIFRRSKEISTIRQALVVLGQVELKRFLALLFAAQVNDQKPAELIRLSMCRANFCDAIARHHNKLADPSIGFLTGMLSKMDAILDEPMESIMEKLPLSEDIKQALIGKEGLLSDYLKLIESYEHAEWTAANEIIETLELDKKLIPNFYHTSVKWANEHLAELEGNH